MNCFGCGGEIMIGDRYIEDMPSGFIGEDASGVDGVIAELFSGRGDGRIVFCEDCTVKGGEYARETYWGDADDG
jgi:hypothetical protein